MQGNLFLRRSIPPSGTVLRPVYLRHFFIQSLPDLFQKRKQGGLVRLLGQPFQGVPCEAVGGPLVQRYCTKGAVKGNAGLIPV